MNYETRPDEKRLSVWGVLSELFLDTELDAKQHQWIAKVVTESGYSPTEIRRILWEEVFHVLESNLRDPAGVNWGYPHDWLEKNLKVSEGRVCPTPGGYPASAIREEWAKVCTFLPQDSPWLSVVGGR